ncbi:MAG: hypothetical protein IJM40_01605 [Synergistaceae bacterium]|nr:hypothetical protein [Synergistaceae bacterium]
MAKKIKMVHGFTGSRVHGFTGSRVHGFTGSRVHGFTVTYCLLFLLSKSTYKFNKFIKFFASCGSGKFAA